MVAAPFVAQTDAFHHQVPDIGHTNVGQTRDTCSHALMELIFCTLSACMSLLAVSNYKKSIYKNLLLVLRQAMGDRWVLDK